jgi:NADPH:quinone reductase-like Zn-dependent oxidoreductase
LRPYDEGTRGISEVWDEFKIHSWSSKRGWTQHCRGLVGVRKSSKANDLVLGSIDENKNNINNLKNQIIASSVNHISEEHLYQVLTNLGADYGPTFQGLENCYADSYHSHANLYVRDTTSLMPKEFQPPLVVHPAFLDGLLHLVWPILGHGKMNLDTLYMPTLIRYATINCEIPLSAGQHVRAYGTGSPNLPSPQPTSFDLLALADDTSSDPLIVLDGLVMTPIRESGLGGGDGFRKLCYRLEWQPFAEQERLANGHVESESLPNGEASNITKGVLINGDDHHNQLTNGTDGNLSNGANGHAKVSGTTSAENGVLITRFAYQDDETPIASRIVDDLGSGKSQCLLTTELTQPQFADHDVIILQSPNTSLRDATAQQFEAIQAILLNSTRVLWVYHDNSPDAQMSVGLARSVRSETMAKISTLGIDTEDPISASTIVSRVIDVVWPTNGSEPCTESEFKSSGSQLHVLRALEDESSNAFVHSEISDMTLSSQPFHQLGRRFKLKIANAGSLDTIYFADEDVGDLGDDSVEIEVKATGINFKDIVVTMGQLSQSYIGIECSGLITSVGKNVTDIFPGQRVMATPEGAYSTYARCLSTSVTPIPDSMSDEEAATIPIIFCTAYYGLFDLGNLAAGERVLIHAGAGGVGQAAIQLAQMVNADIFVTVGSQDKKRFLMERYNIPEDHILYSRDASFGPALRRATNNEGVDVVLNSLAGDLLRESWECVAPFGRFIEIGKADITKNSRLEMLKFEYNVTFASVDLTKVAKFRPKLMKRLLNDVARLMNEGAIKPIFPITKYSISEVEAGFRALQTGKNIGKSIVVPNQGDKVKVRSFNHFNPSYLWLMHIHRLYH